MALLRPFVANHQSDAEARTTAAEAAMAVWEIFRSNRKVGYWDDLDAQRQTMNEIDDYLYDEVKGARGIELSTDEMDEIIEKNDAARPPPDGGVKIMVGMLTYGADTIHYEVRFLASRQTLAIEVHPDSRVLVRAPVGCPEALVAERVRKRAALDQPATGGVPTIPSTYADEAVPQWRIASLPRPAIPAEVGLWRHGQRETHAAASYSSPWPVNLNQNASRRCCTAGISTAPGLFSMRC